METGLILSFIGASVLLTLMPGPDNIFVLTESITKGYKNGIAISIGLCLGLVIHTIAAATGLSIILQKSAVAFSIIKYLGAAYLFYLAYKAYQEKQAVVEISSASKADRTPFLSLIRTGFFMNILNPKVSLFFIAFFPQFISKDGYSIAIQMTILGIIFFTQAILIFSSIAILSGRLTKYLNNDRFWKITKWGKISVLSALGLTLALSKN